MNVEDFFIELVLRYQVTLLLFSVIGIIFMVGPSYSIMVYFTCLLVSILPLSVILVSVNSKFLIVLKGLFSPLILYPSHTLCWVFFNLVVCVAPFFLIYFDYKTNEIDISLHMDFLLTVVKMFCGCSIVGVVVVSAYLCFLTWYKTKLVASPILSYIHSKIKFIEVRLGIVAYVMVQYIIRGKSVFLMLALLSFTIAWVGIVAIVQPPTDFGVFTFLVGASVDCAISMFGLSGPTWIVCGVCILMAIIYRKLDSVLLLYSGVRGGILRDWTCLELHKNLRLIVGVTDTTIPGYGSRLILTKHIWHIQMSPTTCLKISKGDITPHEI
ncbi:hypothetical protein Leryth_021255 [Lithospermum erythrorhizon]|nr:hypothetical protein Leryth_021255 [Lithospermum erythrorhizon]